MNPEEMGPGMTFLFLLVVTGVIWWLIDRMVTGSKGNPNGCLKVIYLGVSALLLFFLAILALGFLSYPLRNP